jgi:hypothetical protein
MDKQIDNIVDKIENRNTQQLLKVFFNKDIPKFNQNIQQLEIKLTKGVISNDEMCFQVTKKIREILKKAAKIEKIIPQRLILKKIKSAFRMEIKYFIDKSLLIQRGLTKPLGHPGDFRLIEMVYDNISNSKGIGLGGDRYMLEEDGYVEAIRIRKDIMRKQLSSFIEKSPKKSLNIINLGCGSCREIKELLNNSKFTHKRINFTLIDWDEKALDFSKISLKKYQKNTNINFTFRQEDVRGFYRNPDRYKHIFKNQDFIYTIGLPDYIPDLIFGGITECCFDLLGKTGALVIAHKNIKTNESLASDWFCDWNFYPRDARDVKLIIKEALGKRKFTAKSFFEKTRHIFFLTISKT